MSSSDDDDGFGGLFGEADDTTTTTNHTSNSNNNANKTANNNNNNNTNNGTAAENNGNSQEEQFPLKSIHVDRIELATEGSTYSYFAPAYDHFDNLLVKKAINGGAADKKDSTSGGGGDGGKYVEVPHTQAPQRLKKLERQLLEKQQQQLSEDSHDTTGAGAPPSLSLPIYYREKRHSLWGHKLWNAAKYISKQMDAGRIDCRGKRVLELGAGLAAPAVVAFRNGASLVVATDYPDADLLEVIEKNMHDNCGGAAYRLPASEEARKYAVGCTTTTASASAGGAAADSTHDDVHEHDNRTGETSALRGENDCVDEDAKDWFEAQALSHKRRMEGFRSQQPQQQQQQQQQTAAEGSAVPTSTSVPTPITLSPEERRAARNDSQRWAVEPLLWGHKEHIQRCLEYTTPDYLAAIPHYHHTPQAGRATRGFDIVILSDILFNHVCNDDLADTLAAVLAKPTHYRQPHDNNNKHNNNNNSIIKSEKGEEEEETLVPARHRTSSAAYCVFSHHRAHKQMEDFEFFDKVVARGLRYRQIDEQDYPMMFPEDRGPEAVRQPVKCYKIFYEEAPYEEEEEEAEDEKKVAQTEGGGGCAAAGPRSRRAAKDAAPELVLDVNGGAEDTYDCVVQGTGLVQCYLASALARNNPRDGDTDAAAPRRPLRVLVCDGAEHYGGTAFSSFSLDAFVEDFMSGLTSGGGGDSSDNKVILDRREAVYGGGSSSSRARRQWVIDVVPSLFMCRGESVLHLIESKLAGSLDFHFLSHFSFLKTHEGGNSSSGGNSKSVTLWRVPLSRAQIYAHGGIGLLDKRRLLKFIKDVEATLAESHHAKDANPSDDPNYRAADSNNTNTSSNEHTNANNNNNNTNSGAEGEQHHKQEDGRSSAQAHSAVGVTDADAVAFLQKLNAGRGGRVFTSLRQLLSEHYGLGAEAIDYITLMGALDRQLFSPDASTAMQRDSNNNNNNGDDNNNNNKGHSDAELAASSNRHILSAVHLVRTLLHSVGYYGGSSPFLVSGYGSSGELCPALARQAAVWGGSVCLRTSVAAVQIDSPRERLYVVLSNGQRFRTRALVLPAAAAAALPLTEVGDWRQTWALAREREEREAAAEEDGKDGQEHAGHATTTTTTAAAAASAAAAAPEESYARVVAVSRRPLFTRAQLQEAAAGGTQQKSSAAAGEGEEEEERAIGQQTREEQLQDSSAPTAVFLLRLPSEYQRHSSGGGSSPSPPSPAAAAAAGPVVYVHQLGSEVDAAPRDGEENNNSNSNNSSATGATAGHTVGNAVIHFTARLADVTPAELLRFVRDYFLTTESPSTDKSAVDNNNSNNNDKSGSEGCSAAVRLCAAEDLVLLTHYAVTPGDCARGGLRANRNDPVSEVYKTDDFALVERLRLTHSHERNSERQRRRLAEQRRRRKKEKENKKKKSNDDEEEEEEETEAPFDYENLRQRYREFLPKTRHTVSSYIAGKQQQQKQKHASNDEGKEEENDDEEEEEDVFNFAPMMRLVRSIIPQQLTDLSDYLQEARECFEGVVRQLPNNSDNQAGLAFVPRH